MVRLILIPLYQATQCMYMYMYIASFNSSISIIIKLCPSISKLVKKHCVSLQKPYVNRDANPSGHNVSEFHGHNCVWLHVKLHVGNQS